MPAWQAGRSPTYICLDGGASPSDPDPSRAGRGEGGHHHRCGKHPVPLNGGNRHYRPGVHATAVNILSASSLIATFGVAGVLVVLLVEIGLLVGFFLPGDTMLFVAGFAASGSGLRVPGARIHLPLGWLLLASAAGAVAGGQIGYYIGRRFGPALFARPGSRLFKEKHIEQTRYYFDRFGPGKAVVIARFIPVVRTFVNPLAGTVGMPGRDFTVWNVIGGIGWTVAVILMGYFLHGVAVVRQHVELLIVAVTVISVIPLLIEAARRRQIPAPSPRREV